jgi:hypothetical protein
LLIPC